MRVRKIISGGQTGVDRAALDVALRLNIRHGGMCPKGRLAEDGVIPTKYRLIETNSTDYRERTKLNVKNSDGTLIFLCGKPLGGTLLTIDEAKKTGKPSLIVDPTKTDRLDVIRDWIISNNIEILNIAGPRASQAPAIYKSTYNLLLKLFI
jgi:hypothetical protein